MPFFGSILDAGIGIGASLFRMVFKTVLKNPFIQTVRNSLSGRSHAPQLRRSRFRQHLLPAVETLPRGGGAAAIKGLDEKRLQGVGWVGSDGPPVHEPAGPPFPAQEVKTFP